jgi:neutral ceramidase
MICFNAGAAAVDISPRHPVYLAGYPNVERISTGVHDPLMSTALFLDDGRTRVLMIANDVLFITKELAARARSRISARTGVPGAHILIAATHTHSGPLTVDRPHRRVGSTAPPPDPGYMALLEQGIVEAGTEAFRKARPAEAGLAVADATGVGTNRRDPAGPSFLRVPVLSIRDAVTHAPLAVMTVTCMHPTVLHEDSTRVSSDFPGMMRQYLQRPEGGSPCPVVYFSGPAGNQSPRHVTRGNTFEEAERLGALLGRAVEKALGEITYQREWPLAVGLSDVDLPRQVFPPVDEAEAQERAAFSRLETLRKSGEPRTTVRTAECDWFGAARRTHLARSAVEGRLEAVARLCMPAEIQAIAIGPWVFVGWAGEVFIEFALEVIRACPQAFLIAYANGETDGYLVTAEAAAEGGYEAASGIFISPESGERLVKRTLECLGRMTTG